MALEENYTHRYQYAGAGESVDLAVKVAKASDGSVPGFVWLGGFRSDMAGTKAEAMVEEAELLGAASLRFDYSGHGQSGGAFTDGTISRWVSESLDVFRAYTHGPQILLGSSMGGWIALRLASELKRLGETDRLAGMVLIAPAPDFTSELMEPAFTDQQILELAEQGFISEPSDYSDEPSIITKALIDDGRANQIFGSAPDTVSPVHILQGMQDPDVPWQHAMRLLTELSGDDVSITLVKDGDHRLSRPQDIVLVKRTMRHLLQLHSI